jgi:hypothetical protein
MRYGNPCLVDALSSKDESDANFKTMRWWLKTCENNHMHCKQSMPSRTILSLPTRLLDLGPGAHPRLCLDNSINEDRKYMTLIHCWGDRVPLKLMKETLSSFFPKHRVGTLTKDFQRCDGDLQTTGSTIFMDRQSLHNSRFRGRLAT